MYQLRCGIRLKKVDYSRTPQEFEMTPYEVMALPPRLSSSSCSSSFPLLLLCSCSSYFHLSLLLPSCSYPSSTSPPPDADGRCEDQEVPPESGHSTTGERQHRRQGHHPRLYKVLRLQLQFVLFIHEFTTV